MSECLFPYCKQFAQPNGYCIGHRHFSSSVSVKPAKKIPVRSDKQKAVMVELKKLYKIFLAKHPRCMAKLEGCTKQASEIHHSAGRVGANATDTKTFIALCHNCHRYVEENPQAAKEMGLSKSRLKKD